MSSTEYRYNWTWSGYNPIATGWEACSPNHYFGPGIREFYTTHFIMSGKGIFVVKGKEYNLQAGQLFTFSPYDPVYYKADEAEPWSYVWINFMINGTVPYRFEQPVVSAPFLQPIFQSICNYDAHAVTGKTFTTDCLMQIAAALNAHHMDAKQLVNRAVHLIQTSYSDEKLSIEEIAAKLGISRYTLSAIFSAEKDVSPSEYLIRYRLKKACEYMTEHKLSAGIAANSVGYTNYVHFSRIFKKYYGVSPKVFQQQTLNAKAEQSKSL